jgi:hypothetical protein
MLAGEQIFRANKIKSDKVNSFFSFRVLHPIWQLNCSAATFFRKQLQSNGIYATVEHDTFRVIIKLSRLREQRFYGF